jgi:protein-S-isoprenylcysteine O-methyltransferase Ste14
MEGISPLADRNIFFICHLGLLIATELFRGKFYLREIQHHRKHDVLVNRGMLWERLLFIIMIAGTWGLPIIAWRTDLVSAAHRLPSIPASLLGFVVYLTGFWILASAHHDLNHNWTLSPEIIHNQKLVTTGLYASIRHPIYAAVWMMTIAQALIIPNWAAGFSGMVSFLPMYLFRVRAEERMMLEYFGTQYQQYLQQTGRLIPKTARKPVLMKPDYD